LSTRAASPTPAAPAWNSRVTRCCGLPRGALPRPWLPALVIAAPVRQAGNRRRPFPDGQSTSGEGEWGRMKIRLIVRAEASKLPPASAIPGVYFVLFLS
jgi:hypothetical protein